MIMKSLFILLTLASSTFAELPDGPGKVEVEKICQQCHEIQRAIGPRQDHDAWASTVSKMVNLGAVGTNEQFYAIIEYLSAHYPADPLPKINANTARAIEFESAFSMRRSVAARLIAHREKNGPFKSAEDIEKVPGVDAASIEKRKDRLVFQ
jgi:competence protein ComEA